MKYIKTYESIQSKLELKKYIIWKNDKEKIYSIMEITQTRPDNFFDFLRFFCVVDDKILKDNRRFTYINLDSVLKNTIYTSDELDDCVNHMKAQIASKKYNL